MSQGLTYAGPVRPGSTGMPADQTAIDPNNQVVTDNLAAYVKTCFDKAYTARNSKTLERLLMCERQRRGVYDPERLQRIREQGGSEIFMMVTDIKCRAAESWIKDVMYSSGERTWDLEPQHVPDLPPEIKQAIMQMAGQEMQKFMATTGQPVLPGAFMARIGELHDQVIRTMREQADKANERMADKMEDQMDLGHWQRAFSEFLSDFVTYPFAILKGPTIRRRKTLEWGQGFKPVVTEQLIPEFERVSPYDFFPSANARRTNEGYIIERHRLTRATLAAMKGTPGYKDDAIDMVLDQFGKGGLHSWLVGDIERDNLEGRFGTWWDAGETIDAFEYYGSVSGAMLIEWGMSKGKKIDPYKEYEANVWCVGPHAIKAVLNADPLGRRPYSVSSWETIPGSLIGKALPETMRDTQVMCNAAARALANNMAISSGPQVEVTIDRLPDGERVTALRPWKLWQVTSDKTGGGQPAMRFYQPTDNSQSLMGVYTFFAKQSDEVTGIPNYTYGSSQVAGAGRTASGLSMLMENASKVIKDVIYNIDMAQEDLLTRLYHHNMIYDDDITIKGEMNITSKGVRGLMMREQMAVRRGEFLQQTNNPVDLQIVGQEGRAYVLREVAKNLQLDTDKVVPPTPPASAAPPPGGMAPGQPGSPPGPGPQGPSPVTTGPGGSPAGGLNLVQPRS